MKGGGENNGCEIFATVYFDEAGLFLLLFLWPDPMVAYPLSRMQGLDSLQIRFESLGGIPKVHCALSVQPELR